jgi:putative tryptophan/tyrosine transport system substrate-binding protein
MRRRELIALLGSVAALSLAARAQQPGKVYSIGFLTAGASAAGTPALPAFVEALQELGWIEGKNIIFEYRYGENRLERLPNLAAELARLRVDVIVAAGTLAPLAAKHATTAIPIVMTSAGDPLGSGLVASLARPGGNVTGLSLMVPDLAGKRLQLLKDLLPRLSRVAVLWDAGNPYPAQVFKEAESAAQMLGLEVQSLEVREPDDFNSVFGAARSKNPDALVTVEDPLTVGHRKQIVAFAARNQLPAIYGLREFVEVGGLMAYGASISDLYRRAAVYVDKILKGARPADLPVEQPTKFEFVINLRTAHTLGLTIPPAILARADEVIE